jgi:hypothetical protein
MRNGGKRGTKLAKLHVLCLRSTLGKDEKCVQNFGLETRQQRFILAPRRRGEHIYIYIYTGYNDVDYIQLAQDIV